MNNENLIGQQAMVKSIEILRKLCKAEIIPHACQNERYLHHYYSKEIQEHFEIDFRNLEKSKLHPEWPTSKKSTGINCSKYRKNDENKYIVTTNGSSGFIDFAIGDYKEPEFAIEFTSKYVFSREDLTYDFMKLLDDVNPFKNVISFNLIYREKGLPEGGDKQNIIDKLESIREDITKKEKGRNLKIAKQRRLLFWIVEIDQKRKKRFWICENAECKFKVEEEIPDFNKYLSL